MIRFQIRLFGELRKYGRAVAFEVNQPVTALELKRRLVEHFNWDEAILASSAIANTHTVLRDDAILGQSEEIAILPPVCGG